MGVVLGRTWAIRGAAFAEVKEEPLQYILELVEATAVHDRAVPARCCCHNMDEQPHQTRTPTVQQGISRACPTIWMMKHGSAAEAHDQTYVEIVGIPSIS